ncbi:hypothetical protein D3C78_1440730 [compost metagenome]
MPAVGGAQGDALGAVVGRTTTQRHDEITLTLLQQPQPELDIGDAWVGLGAVENHRVDVLYRQQLGHLGGDAGLGQPRVGDDQGFAKAVVADSDHRFIEAAQPHDVHGGNEKSTAHGVTLLVEAGSAGPTE